MLVSNDDNYYSSTVKREKDVNIDVIVSHEKDLGKQNMEYLQNSAK